MCTTRPDHNSLRNCPYSHLEHEYFLHLLTGRLNVCVQQVFFYSCLCFVPQNLTEIFLIFVFLNCIIQGSVFTNMVGISNQALVMLIFAEI
jgi:hypothetical protein